MNYKPDRWVVVKVTPKAGDLNGIPHCRVLAGWSGGYLDPDSWRLNSGITKVVDKISAWEFHGESGSIYLCRKGAEGLTVLMSGILQQLQYNSDADVAISTAEEAIKCSA